MQTICFCWAYDTRNQSIRDLLNLHTSKVLYNSSTYTSHSANYCAKLKIEHHTSSHVLPWEENIGKIILIWLRFFFIELNDPDDAQIPCGSHYHINSRSSENWIIWNSRCGSYKLSSTMICWNVRCRSCSKPHVDLRMWSIDLVASWDWFSSWV